MTKVYAGPRSTFLLTATDGSTMLIRPNTFCDVPDKFASDITFRSAVASGDLKPFETVKQGDAAESKANEKGTRAGRKKGEREEKPAPSSANGLLDGGDSL